jgi:nitrogen fixation protein
MSVVIDSDNNNVTIVEEAINVTISTGGSDVSAVWGNITGDIEEQTDLIELLDDKVPYTGATTNVDLGEYELKAGQVTLDTSPTGTAAVGTTRWNDTTGTSETTLKGGNVIIKNGVDLVIRVVNKVTPNTTLTKAAYQVVKISGAQGQKLAVALAQANNDNNSADTIGIVIESIATNQEGFVMTVGSLEGINTTGSLQGETWADGDVLYLSPTVAGRITNVKPVAPQHLVVVGYVEYAHANNGKIYVKIMNGWELGELHDVNTTGATNGQVLKYNGSIWVPGSDTAGISSIATTAPITGGTITTSGTIGITQATGSTDGYLSATDWTTFNSKQSALTLTTTGTSGAATLVGATLNIPQYQAVLTNPVTGTGASGQVSYWSGTGTQTGSNNLFWDAVNNRLGIGSNILGGNALRISRSITGTTAENGIFIDGTIQTDVTGGFTGFIARPEISSSSFTLNSLLYFAAREGTSFAGSSATINGQYGYYCYDLAKSTNSFGFYGLVAARTGAWNLYMNGTAANYLAGDTAIGTTTTSGGRLTVRGSGTTSATTALLVQNSTPTNLLQVLDNGRISQTLEGALLSTAFGSNALRLDTGGSNVGFGNNAGNSNTTGTSNSFFGRNAGNANTTGNNNVNIGFRSGENNTTGSTNTFLGSNAGRYITGGATANTISNNSIFIGFDTRAAADNETNQIVIGYQTTGLGSNTATIGNTSTTQTHLYGNLTLGTTTSGARLTVRGSGTTSAANSLLVEDSAGTDTFVVRNDGGYAFNGGTVGLAQTGYTTFSNLTTDRTCDANATTVEELADILGTLIQDLKTKGIISA